LWVSTFYVEQFKSYIYGGSFSGGFLPLENPKFGQNYSLKYNFLHYCEFKLPLLCSSKVSFWGVCYPQRTPNLVRTIVSQTSFYTVSFKSLCWSVQRFYFRRAILAPRGPPNLVRTIIVSQTSSYIVSFKFLCWTVQKLRFGGSHFRGSTPRRTPKHPNLVKIIVSHTTSYILSFNFLCWTAQKFHFWRPIMEGRNYPPPRKIPYSLLHCKFQLSMSSRSNWLFFRPTFWGESFDVELNKNNMQTTPHWSLFSPTLIFLH